MFDGVVHGGLHPAPCGVQVVGRRRPQRLLLQRRHRVVAAHPRVVVQRGLLTWIYQFIYLAALSNDYPFTCMPNMLAAEAAAADGQKLLSPVAPAILRSVGGLWERGGTKGPVVLIQ